MAKMTKAQMRKRVEEAGNKMMKVYASQNRIGSVVTNADMEALSKILNRVLKRLK